MMCYILSVYKSLITVMSLYKIFYACSCTCILHNLVDLLYDLEYQHLSHTHFIPQVVKVADFGVARVKAQSGVMTAETGTYRWMAPEVCSSKH